jgi:hypothetical protein
MNTVNFLAVKAMINSISVKEKTPCVQPSPKTHTWEMKRVHLMCKMLLKLTPLSEVFLPKLKVMND